MVSEDGNGQVIVDIIEIVSDQCFSHWLPFELVSVINTFVEFFDIVLGNCTFGVSPVIDQIEFIIIINDGEPSSQVISDILIELAIVAIPFVFADSICDDLDLIIDFLD